MRPQWIVGIIMGILLLYLGFFGSSGFGIALSWMENVLPTHEPFSTLEGWQEYYVGANGAVKPYIDTTSATPSGDSRSVVLDAGPYVSGTDTRSSITSDAISPLLNAETTWTMVMTMKMTFSTHSFVVSEWYDASYYMGLTINNSGIYKNGGEPKQLWASSWTNDNAYHNWTWCVTRTGSQGAYSATFDVYQDQNKRVTGATCITVSPPWIPGQYDRISIDAVHDAIVNIDTITLYKGLVPPSGIPPPPPTEYGTIRAVCTKDGNAFSGITLTVEGHSELGTKTSDANGYATFTNVPVGDYRVKAVATGFSDPGYADVHVTKGQTVDASFPFITGEPPPDDGDDPIQNILDQIIAAIRNLLNNSSLKTMMMAGGGLITLVSVIMLVVPSGKRYVPVAPS